MSDRIIGQVKRVNGPVIEVMGITDAEMFELVRVGKENLIGELIKLQIDSAVVQVYEDTTGIAPYDPVYGAGMQLSVELGPGMVGTIYDGIQRPLESIREMSGIYIKRGITVPSLDREKKWHFVPSVKEGDCVSGGTVIGTVQETENLLHKILVPPRCSAPTTRRPRTFSSCTGGLSAFKGRRGIVSLLISRSLRASGLLIRSFPSQREELFASPAGSAPERQ